MIDSGLGESHVNNFLSSVGIPTITPQLLKKNERKVGCAIEEVAKESCIDGIQLEKKKTLEPLTEETQ